MAMRAEILEELQELHKKQSALARRELELLTELNGASDKGNIENRDPSEASQFRSLWGIWKNDPPITDQEMAEVKSSWDDYVERLIRDDSP
jgi:hypothetical protein